MIDSHTKTLEIRDDRASLAGLAWLALAVVATLPVFWFGFEGLARSWAGISLRWADFAFRVQVLVPLAALLLLLQVMRSMPAASAPPAGRWVGVAGVVAAVLLAILGSVLRIDHFVLVAMIGWVASILVTIYGLPRAFAFWAPVGSLFLLLMPPPFIRIPINRLLETAAAKLGMVQLRVAGVPVVHEGQYIDFGVHQQRLAEMLPGANVLQLILLACFAFATLYRGPVWVRLIPLIFAMPVMVALASIRIAILGLATYDAPGSAERIVTLTGGFTFFAASIVILLALAAVAHALSRDRVSFAGRFDLDPADLGAQTRRLFHIRATPPLIAAAILSALLSAAFVIGPSRPTVLVERESFAAFPTVLGGWVGTTGTISDETAGVLNSDDYVLIDYVNPNERAPVNFWSAYYYTQDRDKGGIHSPEVCLPLDGWNIVSVRPVDLAVDGPHAEVVRLNRAVIRKGETTALVYYWFDGRGRRLAGEWEAKILLKMDALTTGRTDGALVRYVTPILADETEADADARLQRLLAETLAPLPLFVPG